MNSKKLATLLLVVSMVTTHVAAAADTAETPPVSPGVEQTVKGTTEGIAATIMLAMTYVVLIGAGVGLTGTAAGAGAYGIAITLGANGAVATGAGIGVGAGVAAAGTVTLLSASGTSRQAMLVSLQEDAAAYVASDGETASQLLQATFATIRSDMQTKEELKSIAISDVQLAQAILEAT